MGVHSIYIFDRRGKTLFTKRYAKSQGGGSGSGGSVTTTIEDEEQLSEQRKLIFGMLFSVRELVNNIAPTAESSNKVIGGGLHSVRTAAGTLHNYETLSGLRVALYMDNRITDTTPPTTIRLALKYIYTDLWVDLVVRSPIYSPTNNNIDIASTNFEAKLDAHLASMPWFR